MSDRDLECVIQLIGDTSIVDLLTSDETLIHSLSLASSGGGLGFHGDVHAGGVDLDFTIGFTGSRDIGGSGPVPDPVQGVSRGVDISWELDVVLAPEIDTHEGVRGVVFEDLVAVGRDVTSVELVALSVVEVASGQEDTTAITARSSCVPHLVDAENLVVVFGLRGTVDVDCTAVGWLADLCVGECNVTVFLVPKGDVVAGRSYQGWAGGGLVADGLGGFADVVAGE